MSTRRERGVALITALLVVAVAATAATGMIWREHLAIRRTQNVIARDQAWLYAQAAEAVAIVLLDQDRRNSRVDGLSERWAGILPPIEVGAAEIQLAISDLQGRFNLNALAATGDESTAQAAAQQFRRLLASLHPAYSIGLEAALADWLDADLKPRFPGGAEGDVYSRLDPPYEAANRLMLVPSELRLVAGIDAATYRALGPFVTALPDSAATLNVNTAPPAVLRSLVATTSAQGLEAALALRQKQPWDSVQAFLQALPAATAAAIDPQLLGVASEYFLVHARVRLDRARLSLYSVVHRPRPQQAPIRVIYRSLARP
ncbi:MAG: type II secretion system minor pseudopilin GspK [Nitrococcus sp.]|nr:type II secretion system minor pseudopilin GspK [Nitrococcus sp.]